MTPFYRSFLQDTGGWDSQSQGHTRFLAAFGKHPGWDDHMEDLGLATESLATLKRLLYLEGIARNISAGVWKLEPGASPAFDHVFRWQRGEQYLLGRIFASRDRKGRTFFPLVVCAHLLDHTAPASREVEECVQGTLERCLGTEEAESVRATVAQGLTFLQSLATGFEGDDGQFDLDPLLDQAKIDLSPFSPRKFHPKKSPVSCRFRVARSSDPIPLEQWLHAMRRTKVAADVPLLVLAPLHPQAGWLDVIVGEPTAGDFACLLQW